MTNSVSAPKPATPQLVGHIANATVYGQLPATHALGIGQPATPYENKKAKDEHQRITEKVIFEREYEKRKHRAKSVREPASRTEQATDPKGDKLTPESCGLTATDLAPDALQGSLARIRAIEAGSYARLPSDGSRVAATRFPMPHTYVDRAYSADNYLTTNRSVLTQLVKAHRARKAA